jgi:hypothetical protein
MQRCLRCGTILPEAGECPLCQSPQLGPERASPLLEGPPPGLPFGWRGAVVLGVMLALGLGVLACSGVFSEISQDFGDFLKTVNGR